jgi:hypothetical protein
MLSSMPDLEEVNTPPESADIMQQVDESISSSEGCCNWRKFEGVQKAQGYSFVSILLLIFCYYCC